MLAFCHAHELTVRDLSQYEELEEERDEVGNKQSYKRNKICLFQEGKKEKNFKI